MPAARAAREYDRFIELGDILATLRLAEPAAVRARMS
jgi:hypothetical protein